MQPLLTLCGILVTLASGVWAVPKLWRACVNVAAFIVNFNRAAPVLMSIANEIVRIEKKADEIKTWTGKHEQDDRETFVEIRNSLERQDEVLERQNDVLAEIHSNVTPPKGGNPPEPKESL